MCFESDVLKTLSSIKTKVQQMRSYIEVEMNQYEVHLFKTIIFKKKKVARIFDEDYDHSPDFKC